ncbi:MULTISPECIES: GyrI-like domain-containing protein [unclassified Clostridium]|uniref:GyrI-like domain-containing protein n=1 Tax=unclassified Clostridium TaxID=2614128 RepID=UPI001896FE19|nr:MULTISPECIES: GyrI-like domain-containing protein [unclassified Clostridium]MCR1952542.1 GyrI-like domain-containing protein [Clostridium sp. DSM 100503]
MEKLDYKKAFKDLYLPKTQPMEITVPAMTFIIVDGKGNPNDKDGEYQAAIELLYSLSYTIKMNKDIRNKIENYFDYVVLPLEGLWWLKDDDMDFSKKDKYIWTSMIRQPDFVTKEIFNLACEELKKKKSNIDVSKARLEIFNEGLCVQCMHIGPFDQEHITTEKIDKYIEENNLINDICGIDGEGKIRRHHEIYLSDPRKVNKEKMKTIIRHPVRRK